MTDKDTTPQKRQPRLNRRATHIDHRHAEQEQQREFSYHVAVPGYN